MIESVAARLSADEKRMKPPPLLEVKGVTLQYKTPIIWYTYRIDQVFRREFILLGPRAAVNRPARHRRLHRPRAKSG